MGFGKTPSRKPKKKPIEWTEGRRKAFIVSVLRSGSRRWPPKYLTLNEAKTEKKINVCTKRLAQHYKCASCLQEFTQKDIQVDHLVPAVDPKTGWVDWNTFIERLFCEKDNLQCLCRECHSAKTKEEAVIAKMYKV